MAIDNPTGQAGAENVKNQSEFYELLVQSTEKERQLLELQKQRAETLKLTSELFDKEIGFQNKILLNLQQNQAALKDSLVSQKEINEAKAQEAELEQRRVDAFNAYIKAEQEGRKDKEVYLRILNEVSALEQENKKIADSQVVTMKMQLQQLGMSADVMNMRLEDEKTLLELLEENIDDEQKRKDLLEKARGINENILEINGKINGMTNKVTNSLGLSSKASDTFLGSQLDILASMKAIEGSNVTLTSLIGKNISEALNFRKIMFDLFDTIMGMVVGLDEVGKKLGAATGMGNIFQQEVMTTFNATVRGGGTMEDASTAISGLATGFSKFNPQAEAVNQSLAATIVRLGKIGVDASTAAKTMDFFTRTLRMTEQQSSDLVVELSLMGQQMGMTSQQIMSDFQAVSKDLAVFGSRATDVFKDLEAQAKATGMEISSLVGLAKQFDTFDKAANQAAMLNAVLGTQLSTLELMNMSYDDRVSYLRQEVSFAVGNMENLDMYTQQFIAQALGVSSVAEAQKFLNMSQGEYLKYQKDMEAANKRQEDLAELTKELVPFMQQLKIAFLEIATALGPFVTIIAGVLGFLGKYPRILQSIVAAFLAYNIVQKIANGYTALAVFLTKSNLASKGAGIVLIDLETAAVARSTVAQKAKTIVLGLLTVAQRAYNFALFTTRGRLMLILGAFLLLYALLGQKINPPFIAAFAFMAVGVIALGIALQFVKGKALLAALALALLAGAVGLVFYGIAAMVDSITGLFTTLAESGPGLSSTALGLYAVAGGILAIASAMFALGPFGLVGILAMADGLLRMGNGMEKISSGLERISKLSTALAGLGDNGLIAVSSDGTSTSAIMGTGDVFNNFSGGKMEVEVKMPEMQSPKFDLKVFLQGKELEVFVEKIVDRKFKRG